MLSRRALLASPLAAAAANPKLRIGVMDGVALKPSDPAAVQLAARLGFEGIQVTLGRAAPGSPLPLANPALQRAFLDASRTHKLPLVSTYIDILHVHCLKQDPAALSRAVQAVHITRALNAGILMLVFFGDCALNSPADLDAIVAPLTELAREAEKAQVTLGFENTIPAAADIGILDRVASPALKVYYDIGNATNLYKVDPAAEIRALGRQRICQFHFKDRPYLGQGSVNVPAALNAIAQIGWTGDIVLETGAPSGNRPADLALNLKYLRGLLNP